VSDDLVSEFTALFARPNADVLAIGIDFLLQSLPPPLAQHVRLAAIPHMFTVELLQVMEPDLSTDEAVAAYDQLSTLAIVIPAPGGRALHDNARKYLFGQWLRPEVRALFSSINKRLCAYYAAKDKESAVEALGSHRDHRVFHALGADLAAGMQEFEFEFREERRRGGLSACGALLSLAHEYDPIFQPPQAAILSYHEGRLAAALLDWKAAEDHLVKVLVNQSADNYLRAKARMQLGLVHRERHRFQDAIRELGAVVDEALLNPSLQDVRVGALRELGSTWRDVKRYDKAEALIRTSIELATKRQRFYDVAAGWNSLGTLHATRGDNASAISAYKWALAPLEALGDRVRQAQVLNNLGQVSSDEGSTKEAERMFDESLRVRLEAGDTRGRGLTIESLARHFDRLGDFGRAGDLYQEAIQLLEEVHDFQAAGLAASNLAKMYRRRKLNDLAGAAFGRAVDIFNRGGYVTRADEMRVEMAGIGQHKSIPWWAWLSIGLGVLLFMLLVIAVLLLEME
jgi:tetratricopeptide (TPR) repeat protein